jgi:hypothetical protein
MDDSVADGAGTDQQQVERQIERQGRSWIIMLTTVGQSR